MSYLNIVSRYLREFNMFPSIPPTNDPHRLTSQLISTRLFILVFIVALTVLILYTSTIQISKTFTIKHPTLQQYTQLYDQYPKTLSCPCTQISITYDKIIDINFDQHQICYSDFVNDRWTQYIVSTLGSDLFTTSDFRLVSPFAFQALRYLCELSNGTINNNLRSFYQSQYITSDAVPLDILKSEVESSFNRFRTSTIDGFLLSLEMVRATTQANWLLPSLRSTGILYWTQADIWIKVFILSYGNCSCAAHATCVSPLAIHPPFSLDVVAYVRGMYVGCYILEALLQSHLACFYDQLCFDQLITLMNSGVSWSGPILDSTRPSRYLPNSTIDKILNEMMVERWNWTFKFSEYYSECNVKECSYTIEINNNIIYIITTVIGLMGGLTTGLKLIIPNVVTRIDYIRRKRRNRQIASVTTSIVENKT